MSVMLSSVSPRCAVSGADDPYKKHWWAILLGFALIGLWLAAPMMGEKSVGSIGAEGIGKLKTDADVEQSLAPLLPPMPYIPGESMPGSMLYQPVGGDSLNGEPAVASAQTNAASATTLAAALTQVSQGRGGWSEKAQKGFNAPKLAGGAPSGAAAAGGRAGAVSGSSAFGTGAFGARNAEIGYAAAKNLSGGNDPAAAGSDPQGLAALRSAAASAAGATVSGGDAAATSLRRAFDGAKGQNQIRGAGGTVLSGAYAALDAAPINLKLSDPQLDSKKIGTPPAVDLGPRAVKDTGMGRQLAMSMIGILVGGAIGGTAGGIAMQVISQAAQRQEEQARRVRDVEDRQRLDEARRKIGLRPTARE